MEGKFVPKYGAAWDLSKDRLCHQVLCGIKEMAHMFDNFVVEF